MKMQRSHCENENVQFVQELAEVDGPFESPININFKDLTKLELPSLVWNRAEVSPKKMKITNTGHTVIISGKWKCERPYLTGGPLSGKYVFSQIHFHWGQDDCKGSEHQICGEGFPLEMHVAHFKTEYLTQECALREKDGMVVVVYLFKLQDEPNASLKKILNLLPNVKQASTSCAVDPRPILSLCNPFTDDYFMYWGSVVTSTCAHILLWIISREPFGISREQVNEFRKILDTSHQPICRNSRDTQPLHRRNVFHVNASKHLDEALLPIKKVLGCYCKGSEDNVSSKSASNECNCQAMLQNQEDVEGNIVVEHAKTHHFTYTGDMQTMHCKANLPGGCFAQQSIFVQTAMIHSVPMLVKRFDSEPVGNHSCIDNFKQTKSEGDTQLNPFSKSCCFFPTKEVGRIKGRAEKKKIREKKKPFNSVRAFSHLMDSLEAIKNQTFKKLKEIESINQEIKGMKPFCYDSEDKRWLRKIEKIISRQKRFTLKSSQGCFGELKKLAKECNFDKFFDGKAFQVGDNNHKMMLLNDNEIENGALSYSYKYLKGGEVPRVEMASPKQITSSQANKFSAKAQKLIQSFFEDIKESDDLQETVKKDLNLKKIESLYGKQAGDSNPVSTMNKGYITQRMFNLGNLGDRFFKEVSTDDFKMNENEWTDEKETEEMIAIQQDGETEKTPEENETEKTVQNDEPAPEQDTNLTLINEKQETTLLHKGNAVTEFAKTSTETAVSLRNDPIAGSEEEKSLKNPSDSETLSSDDKLCKPYLVKESRKKSLRVIKKELYDSTDEKLLTELKTKIAQTNVQRSSSYLSTESTETQRMIAKMDAKIHKRQSRGVWEQKSSLLFTIVSSKGLYGKNYKKQKVKNLNFESYYMQKKTLKKRKGQRNERKTDKSSWDLSSTSKEEAKPLVAKSKWKRPTKTKFRLELKKSSGSTIVSAMENSLISPERKKPKLDCYIKPKAVKESKILIESKEIETQENFVQSDKSEENEIASIQKENSLETQNKSVDSFSAGSQQITLQLPFSNESINEFGDVSVTSTHKLLRVRSADSVISFEGKRSSEKSEENDSLSKPKTEPSKKELQNFVELKTVNKNWSLTSLTTATKLHSEEIDQRIFVEPIDDRRQNPREISELTQTVESSTKADEETEVLVIKDVSNETSNENKSNKSEDDGEQKETAQSSENAENNNTQAVNKVEYNVRFFTTSSNQPDEELLPKSQVSDRKTPKNATAKRCDEGKYQFLEAEQQETNEDFTNPIHQTESDKSYSKYSSKGDAEQLFPSSEDPPTVENNERETSISFTALKKNPTSRHHSVETLVSVTKTMKRKTKKRPHCSKRSSRHYMRKNSSVFKKPSKVESKQFNLLSLTNEEQIKIISANVAKYLKQKLVEQNTQFDEANDTSFKDIEEVVYKNLTSQGETKEELPQESSVKETEIKIDKTPEVKFKEKTKKIDKKKENKKETLVLKAPDEPEPKKSEKPASGPPKPVHNFIKRNKQMAGQYKRSTEKSTEVKKKEEEKTKQETSKVIPKAQSKKKDKCLPQKFSSKDEQVKPTPESTSSQKNQKQAEKSKKESRIKSPKTQKKPDSKNQKSAKNSEPQETKPEPKSEPKSESKSEPKSEAKSEPKAEPKSEPKAEPKSEPKAELKAEPKAESMSEPKPEAEAEELNQLVECKENANDSLPPPIVLRKIPQPKKRLVPAYMMTSYLPTPIEIVESQQRKMNKYLLSMNNANLESYIPEVLQEVKNRKRDRSKSDPIFERELEYLIKLQMCLNEEITTNIENSMNYVKTLLTPDYPVPYLDSGNNKGVVLVEMKDLECSSSCSDLTEDIHKYYLGREVTESKSDSNVREKQISCIKMPKDSGDTGNISPPQCMDAQEDFNSDSSYDCKISITLNPNAREGEGEMQCCDTITYLDENFNSQTTINLDASSSQSTVTRTQRKKRKENEISMEMKQKVLEILEGEIRKREIGISSEMSSDGVTMRGEDSDGNNRSHSTESSCDMEMLTQISETMKQYLSDFKERKLKEIVIESSAKESKDDESAC